MTFAVAGNQALEHSILRERRTRLASPNEILPTAVPGGHAVGRHRGMSGTTPSLRGPIKPYDVIEAQQYASFPTIVSQPVVVVRCVTRHAPVTPPCSCSHTLCCMN